MPGPSTSAELLELVRKSELVEPEKLETYVERLQGTSLLPDDARKLAGMLVRDGLLTFFQAGQLMQGKYRGFTLGSYKVLERLGSGGMGTVYLCEHQVMHRQVAIKVLPAERATDPAYLGRFRREAQAVAALDHANIVRAHDVCQEGRLHFLVMEYVDGVSLQELVQKRGPLDAARAAHYIQQAALGLEHARAAGLVHRDIKPGNLIVNRAGVVKILDMGLALFYDDRRDTLTSEYDDRSVLGTADYLAPEQAMSSHDVDIRADIYSLGATFYYLLTGSPPFGDGTVAQKLVWHQMRPVKPIRQVRPEVPEGLAAVVQQMLAKDPNDRQQTPGELAEALEPWANEALAPPAEDELHRLSRAAQGNGSAGGGRPPSTARRAAGTTAGPGERLAEAPTRVSRQPRPDSPKSASQVSRPMEQRLESAVRVARVARRRLVWAAAAGGGLAVVALVAVLLGSSSHPTRERGPASQDAGTAGRWIVSQSGRDGSVRTVHEALSRAHAGDRILVRDEILEEALMLPSDGGAIRDVTIEGAAPSGRPVLWRPPSNAAAGQPLLRVAGATTLHLKGFQLDGQNRVSDLIVLSGSCPGLTLEDLHLQGFQHAGVRLHGCAGEPEHPVVFARLRCTSEREADAAVLFTAEANEDNQHILVRDCRFEGPYQAAVQIDSSLTDVQLTRSRFFKAAAGVLCKKANPRHRLQLTVANNTFADLGKGLQWEVLPSADRVVARDNLFVRTKRLGWVDGLTLEPGDCRARWIWFDEPKTPRGGFPAESRYFRKSFDVPATPADGAVLDIACDDAFDVWLNGVHIGRSPMQHYTKHVYHFDVTASLRQGRNVFAVQGSNQADFFTGRPTDAALLVQLTYTPSGAGAPVRVVSDESWKAMRSAPANWQQLHFDDGSWPAVKVVEAYDSRESGPWVRLVWDSVVRRQFPGGVPPIQWTASGNVRDYNGAEGYPSLEAHSGNVTLPAEPANDAQFLRYSRTSPLAKLGSPGVPPEEK